MSFGKRLRELREENKITQKELGKIINISDRVIGYYESEERFPRDENIIKKLSEYFDVSIDYLLGKTNIRNINSNKEIQTKQSYDNLLNIITIFFNDKNISNEDKEKLKDNIIESYWKCK